MSAMGSSTFWGKITVLIAVCGWCLSAQAKYDGGSGEPNNPYQISSVTDWQELMATPADWGSYFILTADIDLNDVSITPIAPDTGSDEGFQGTQFTGFFDGSDYVIHNVDVNMPYSSFVGLFGCLGTGGQIRNLGVKDVSIHGRTFVGGLVGFHYWSSPITNCYSTGSVTGNSHVGGLVGRNFGSLINCSSNGSVTGDSFVGGLVGYDDFIISNCYSSASAAGDWRVGGLVGNSYHGTITNSYSTGSVSGGRWSGGI